MGRYVHTSTENCGSSDPRAPEIASPTPSIEAAANEATKTFAVGPFTDLPPVEDPLILSEAMADAPFHWQWSSILSADGPPSVFIAIWFESFSGMTQLGDGPAQVMSDTYGPEKAAMIMNAFGEAVTMTSSQIWMLRPDLSYVPM